MIAVTAMMWLAGVLALAEPEPARRQLEASIGLSSALMFEALVLRNDAGVGRDHRLVSKPLGFDVGLQWYWRRGQSFATGGWRGWALASVELMLPRGLFPVGLEFGSVREFKVRPRLSLLVGAALSGRVTLPDPSFSHAQVSAVLGLSLRRVDILFTPGLALPLARDRSEVLGGTMDRRVAALPVPFAVALRFKLGRSRGAQGDSGRARQTAGVWPVHRRNAR